MEKQKLIYLVFARQYAFGFAKTSQAAYMGRQAKIAMSVATIPQRTMKVMSIASGMRIAGTENIRRYCSKMDTFVVQRLML